MLENLDNYTLKRFIQVQHAQIITVGGESAKENVGC